MFFTALQQEITWKRPGGTTKVKSVNQALEIYFDIKKNKLTQNVFSQV